ncbi:MAG: GNAT family N-acetyltransferase [Phenylobacterium sp.]
MTDDLKPWFPIRTERLLLREFRQADFDDVHAYATQPEVVRFMDWGPNTPDETQAFLGRMFEAQARWPRDDVNLAVEHRADGRVIGSIRLGANNPAEHSADLGYSFNRDYWRQGIATEAARAMLDVAFRVLGVHRVWAWCDVRNAGSYGVMEKLGMRREGELKQNVHVKGDWRTTYLYAILADEFDASRRGA